MHNPQLSIMKRNSDGKSIVHIYTAILQWKMCVKNGAIIMMDRPNQIT